jgi:hypothetical protein
MAGKLISDWFGRRAEDAYTFNNEDRFLSWDRGRSSLSSFFTRSRKGSEVSSAAKILGSMFKVMDVPKKVRFDHSGHRNRDKIQIPISMLKDEDDNYTDSVEHLDAFYGAALQNAALRSFQSLTDYQMTLNAKDVNRSGFKLKDLLFAVLNTERIDKKMSYRFPGYLKFVQKYKDFKFDENYQAPDESDPARKRLLDLVLRMLRYPTHLTEEEMEEFEKPMKHMQRLLKKFGGIPATADECKRMATSLANMIYKYTEEEEPPKGDGSGEGGGEGDPDDSSDDDSSSDSSEEDDSSGSDEENSEDEEDSPSEMSKSELDELAKEFMSSIMQEEDDDEDSEMLDDVLSEFEEGMEEDSTKMDRSYEDDGNSYDCPVIFEPASKGNKTKYQQICENINKSKATVLRKLFERKNKDYQFALKSMRSGRLDAGKIAEAIQRVPTVYERVGEVKTDKICVGVLIDESGSMGSGGRIVKAREAAIFINEVFKDSKDVDLFIYGHTADLDASHSTEITIYKDKKHNDPYALSNVRARSNNRDGDAILATARAMRRQTERKGILFVLSDGQPAAFDYHGKEAISDTASKVKRAEKLGFQVIQIAIDECVPSKEMFTHFVKMTDINNLPNELTMYLSRKVDKLIQERVTL